MRVHRYTMGTQSAPVTCMRACMMKPCIRPPPSRARQMLEVLSDVARWMLFKSRTGGLGTTHLNAQPILGPARCWLCHQMSLAGCRLTPEPGVRFKLLTTI
jgi:hypothetical protein